MKIVKKLIKYGSMFALFLVIVYIGIYVYAKMSGKVNIQSANSYSLYDSSGKIFSGYNNNWIKVDKVSKDLINATISIEDKNFYQHIGFDYLRILKAMYINIKTGTKKQGASTISQQYAKNLFLVFDKTWNRKIEEAWLTINLETHYSKDQILEGYLNTINYGGIYGIENASNYYFGVSAKDLDLAQAAMLAGIPKSPSYYSPITNIDNAKERQLTILNSMVKNKYITEEQKDEAYNEKLTYIGKLKSNDLSTLMYYQDAVMDELKKIDSIPSSLIKTGGLKIYTDLDIGLQTELEKSINTYVKDNKLQIASIVTDPNSGKILALVGGTDYSKSEYNRAISAKRQVGSTFKPFLYYSAIENGFTASTTFNSTKTTFVFSNDKKYSPNNFGNVYANKEISMAAALAYSDNIYAVKTHLFLGEDTLVNMLKRVGITSTLDPIPSLALGTSNINLKEMITAYSSLANYGYKVKPHLIEKVEDASGNVLYEFKEDKEAILSKSIVYIINELLSNCYSSNFIDYNYPTCINIAAKLTNKYALKTGSTDSDALVFGYNSNILMGVWAGYDNNSKIPSNVSTDIKNVWADTIEAYFKGKKSGWYDMPSNVVGSLVNPITGKAATSADSKAVMLYYIKGTEPTVGDDNLDDLVPTVKQPQ
jgi:1A family penicillin-binding protein